MSRKSGLLDAQVPGAMTGVPHKSMYAPWYTRQADVRLTRASTSARRRPTVRRRSRRKKQPKCLGGGESERRERKREGQKEKILSRKSVIRDRQEERKNRELRPH